ncbi:hypothetical protein HAPAU_41600 [Halalkalicoccus paucihalophilus]|uniref:Uncharacterized protein n=1 Tax=Halalkalicoccus paucihalophilus TaxID=1008153 RepID=A0A151A8U1_9EURY|nr:hypothetical protein HAPAU_41600 [Halalkalicoccus paucihalophilus]
MRENTTDHGTMKRRGYLKGLTATGLGAGTIATATDRSRAEVEQQDSAAIQDTDSYIFEQGDVCQPIEPLESGETIEEFYDYRDHQTHPEGVERSYSSYGTTHLQEDDTSILFLHEGPNGLSLVMVHGRLGGDGDENYVTFDLIGLPNQADWVVRNDSYTSEENVDEFHRGDGWASASWLQRGDRTGGGAIQGGFDGEFAVTIQPAFNDEATVTPENHGHPDPDFYDEGEMEAWHVLSGSADDPDRMTLSSLEEPVTIRTGTCEAPSIVYDRSDDGITVDVVDAEPDDRVSLQPTTGTNDAIQFEQIEITGVDGDFSLNFENEPPERVPSSPDGTDSLSYLLMNGEPAQDIQTSVTFSIDRELLEEQDLEPKSIALYEAADGEWVQSETTVSNESDTGYQFIAEVSSLEAVTVAEQQGDTDDDDGPEVLSLPVVGGITLGALPVIIVLWVLRNRR